MAVIDDLREIGLSEYEAKTYRALVESGQQTGRQVAELSKVPPTRVFDVLKKLQEKGLVELIQQKPMVWLAVKPEAGFKALVDRRNTVCEELGKRLVGELKRVREEPEKKIFERISIQSGSEEVIAVVTEQIKKSIKEVCSYSIGDPLPAHADIENARTIRRGVIIKQIVRNYTEQNKQAWKKWVKEGWKVRYLPGTEDYSFFVFDKKRCAIVVKDPKVEEEKIIIVFENEGLSSALHDYFDTLWEKARSIDQAKPVMK
jgi:sugar-specific transcriptional regulator TrmB